jgi:ribosomal protein L24E
MNSSANKNHWENVYETKNPDQVSWTQKKPQTSLDFINSFGLGKQAKIIDIGGGDSNLVDFCLKKAMKILRFWIFLPKLWKKQSKDWETKPIR